MYPCTECVISILQHLTSVILFNILTPRQKDHYSQKGISRFIFWTESVVFWFRYYWNLFLSVQLTRKQHKFGKWTGTEQATYRYPNQRLPSYWRTHHYNDVIMDSMASQITSLTIYSGGDQRKHQSSASLVFVRGIHRGPMNSPQKSPMASNAENVSIWWRHHDI